MHRAPPGKGRVVANQVLHDQAIATLAQKALPCRWKCSDLLTCGGAAFVVDYSQVCTLPGKQVANAYMYAGAGAVTCWWLTRYYAMTACNSAVSKRDPYTISNHDRLNIFLHSLCTQDERLQAGRLDFLGGRDLGGAGRLVELGYSYAQEHVPQIDRHFGVVASCSTAAAVTTPLRLDNHQPAVCSEDRDWEWNQHGDLESVVVA